MVCMVTHLTTSLLELRIPMTTISGRRAAASLRTMLGSEAKSVRSASGPPTPAGALLRRAGTLLGGEAQAVSEQPPSSLARRFLY
jgi:hypothetical protein